VLAIEAFLGCSFWAIFDEGFGVIDSA